MKFLNLDSIKNKLALLILLTITPCLAILLYSGLEQRRHLIEMAKSDVLLLTHSIAEAQKSITQSTRLILSTLSETPTIQAMEPNACSEVLKDVLKKNHDYNNFTLVDLTGKVIASGKPFTETNLADRKHLKEALEKNGFAIGEYIVTRVGTKNPSLAFAYPVLDKEGEPKAVLTAALKLDVFSNFYDVTLLPEKSFLALTDYRGIRLFYYPPQVDTNPVGKPIQAKSWNIASKGGKDGLFLGTGSDNLPRMFAYVKIHLDQEDTPYLYVWAGVPESYILAPANAALRRNLLLLLLITLISLFISWVLCKNALIAPLQNLVIFTQKFAKGVREPRGELPVGAGELGILSKAFHDMAESLTLSRKELEESESRYRAFFEKGPDGVVILNPETAQPIEFNDKAFQQLGYSREEFAQLKLFDIEAKETAEEAQEHIQKILKEGYEDFETLHRTKQGELRHIHVTAQLINAKGNDIYLCIWRDITEKVKAIEALIKSEDKFRSLYEKAPLSYQSLDELGNFLEVNDTWLQVLGYQRDEVIGKNFGDFLHPHWKDRFRENLPRFKAVGEVLGVEFEMIKKDGSIILVLLHGKIACNDDGSFVQMHCILSDITQERKYLKERESLENQLHQSQKIESIGHLAGGVAHDFNNMLSIILGYGNILLETLQPDDPLHDYAQEIVNAGNRSASITRQLLAFARKQTIAPKVIDLNETIEEMLKMIRRLIGEDIVLSWHPSSVWPVYIDPSQLDQILANLCLNSRDAITGVGKITIETETTTFDEIYCSENPGFMPGEFVRLAVSDNGIGMDPGTVAMIFEPFFTTKETGKGTGLGMATVYGIVKQNNGFINVYSEPNQGTTINIYLPRHAKQITSPEKKKEDRIPHGQGETILIVEDEASILKLASKILTSLGYVVFTSSTPEEAIKFAKETDQAINLLITDVIMPEMNGRDMANVLLAMHPDLKCLFMSGYTSSVIAGKGVLEDGMHFIQKPFSARDLEIKVNNILKSQQGNCVVTPL